MSYAEQKWGIEQLLKKTTESPITANLPKITGVKTATLVGFNANVRFEGSGFAYISGNGSNGRGGLIIDGYSPTIETGSSNIMSGPYYFYKSVKIHNLGGGDSRSTYAVLFTNSTPPS